MKLPSHSVAITSAHSLVSLHPGDEQASNLTLAPLPPSLISPTLQRRHPRDLVETQRSLTAFGHGSGRSVAANAPTIEEMGTDRRHPSAPEAQGQRRPSSVLDRAKPPETTDNATDSFRGKVSLLLDFVIAVLFIVVVVALSITCSIPYVWNVILQRIMDGICIAMNMMRGQKTDSTSEKNDRARLKSDSFGSGSDVARSHTDADTEAAEWEKEAVNDAAEFENMRMCGCLWKLQEKGESILPLALWESLVPNQTDLSQIVEMPWNAVDLDLWRERYFTLSLSSDGLTLSYMPSRKQKRMKSYGLCPIGGTDRLAVLLPSAMPFVTNENNETDYKNVPDSFHILLLKGVLKDADAANAGKEQYIVLAAATETDLSAWFSIFESCASLKAHASSSSSDAMKIKGRGSQGSAQTGDTSEFDITLHRFGGEQLGIDVDEATLRIDSVLEHGVVPSWNADHPEMKVKPGDVIVKVNGFENIKSMMGECKKHAMIKMRLRTGAPALVGSSGSQNHPYTSPPPVPTVGVGAFYNAIYRNISEITAAPELDPRAGLPHASFQGSQPTEAARADPIEPDSSEQQTEQRDPDLDRLGPVMARLEGIGFFRSDSMDMTNDPRFFQGSILSKRLAAFSGLGVISMLMTGSYQGALTQSLANSDFDITTAAGALHSAGFVLACIGLFANIVATYVSAAQVYHVYRLETAGPNGFEMGTSYYLNPNIVAWRHIAVQSLLLSLPLFLIMTGIVNGVAVVNQYDKPKPPDSTITRAWGFCIIAVFVMMAAVMFHIHGVHSSIFRDRYEVNMENQSPYLTQVHEMMSRRQSSNRRYRPDV